MISFPHGHQNLHSQHDLLHSLFRALRSKPRQCGSCHHDLRSGAKSHGRIRRWRRLQYKVYRLTAVNVHSCVIYYAVLNVSQHASHEEVVKAAELMRVKCHPDRSKRWGGLSSEEKGDADRRAALVGQAADVVCDPSSGYRYDLQRVEGTR